MLIVRVITLIWLFLGSVGYALAGEINGAIGGESTRGFCLSDDDLEYVLIEISVRKLGAMLGTCVLKYPNLAPQGLESGRKFNTKYSAQISAYGKLAKEALEVHGLSAGQREQTYKQAEQVAIALAQTYSEKQCHNVISALHGFVVMGDFAGVKLVITPRADFQSARASTPPCSAH